MVGPGKEKQLFRANKIELQWNPGEKGWLGSDNREGKGWIHIDVKTWTESYPKSTTYQPASLSAPPLSAQSTKRSG